MRSGIEGTISQGIRGFNLCKCRYIGLEKTRLQHTLTAAAMNLERIYAWLEEIPLAQTRRSLKKCHVGSSRPAELAFRNHQNRSIFEFANSISNRTETYAKAETFT